MTIFFPRFLLAALLLATGENHRPGNFRVIGPGGGGAMFHPTVSPHDPNTVLVGCDMTGAYITHDGGKSWRMFNLRGVVQFFVFDQLDSITAMAIDPANSKIFYVAAGDRKKRTSALFVSRDAGQNWTKEADLPELTNRVWVNPSSPPEARMLLLAGSHSIEEKTSLGM